ncbi:hypothetical protein A2U01_0104552, partial [Trifolium medium]|nr:hypothetical protein [Trifolium medium]
QSMQADPSTLVLFHDHDHASGKPGQTVDDRCVHLHLHVSCPSFPVRVHGDDDGHPK